MDDTVTIHNPETVFRNVGSDVSRTKCFGIQRNIPLLISRRSEKGRLARHFFLLRCNQRLGAAGAFIFQRFKIGPPEKVELFVLWVQALADARSI